MLKMVRCEQLRNSHGQANNRCGFPKKRNFKFLETLQLKTVLTLVLEDYPEANLEWCQQQDIQFMVRTFASHASPGCRRLPGLADTRSNSAFRATKSLSTTFPRT